MTHGEIEAMSSEAWSPFSAFLSDLSSSVAKLILMQTNAFPFFLLFQRRHRIPMSLGRFSKKCNPERRKDVGRRDLRSRKSNTFWKSRWLTGVLDSHSSTHGIGSNPGLCICRTFNLDIMKCTCKGSFKRGF